MNEQPIDALPPVQPPASGQTQPGGGFVDPVSQPGLPPVPTTPLTPTPQAPATGSTPAIADDIDLIEKEWVEKAKQIVENTKQDPFQQNQEMILVKADYQKKRYNRDLKTGES